MSKKNIGSSFDEFLSEAVIIDEASIVAVHRVTAWQALQEVEAQCGKSVGALQLIHQYVMANLVFVACAIRSKTSWSGYPEE